LIRNYAFKSDLKIKWVRPVNPACTSTAKSGDRSAFPDIDKSQYVWEFQDCKELETADENVKKLFTLEANRARKTTHCYTKSLVGLVKRHGQDSGSMEVRLAKLTAHIRRMQEVMEEHHRSVILKVKLKEFIDKRKMFLTYLKRWDYKRFEWVLEKLDLEYKAYPTEYYLPTRRISLRKLTDIHCENIKNERLAAYRKQLESQQIAFLQKKLDNLKFIRNEQIECSVPVTVSAEDIKEVETKLKDLINKAENENRSSIT